MKKTEAHLFIEAIDKMDKEEKEFLTDEKNLFDSLVYELANHEYCITRDYDDALSALGLKYEELTEKQLEILKKARREYLDNCQEW